MTTVNGDGGGATLRDAAERAGVSVSTASRALNGKRRVNRELVARVRSAADAVGYQPNLATRSLRTARTMHWASPSAASTLRPPYRHSLRSTLRSRSSAWRQRGR